MVQFFPWRWIVKWQDWFLPLHPHETCLFLAQFVAARQNKSSTGVYQWPRLMFRIAGPPKYIWETHKFLFLLQRLLCSALKHVWLCDIPVLCCLAMWRKINFYLIITLRVVNWVVFCFQIQTELSVFHTTSPFCMVTVFVLALF